MIDIKYISITIFKCLVSLMNLNLVVKCFIPWESAKILLVGIRGLAIDGNAGSIKFMLKPKDDN